MFEAVLLVGGRGTRLAPFTKTIPKPLLPLGDRTILEVILQQLKFYGFSRVTLAVGYMAPLFEAIIGDGNRFGLEVVYAHESSPLGTVGPLSVMDHLGDDFVVMNGDTLTTLDYAALLRSHLSGSASLTIAIKTREEKIDFGIVETNEAGALTAYKEKPALQHDVSMGVYAFSRSLLSELQRGRRLDLPELVLELLRQRKIVNAYRFSGYWLDIGRHDDFDRASAEFDCRRHEFLPSGAHI
jgi:NDP-sugar pyrophosphorylase family protein